MSTAGKLWMGFGLMLLLLVGTGLFVAHRLASIERSLLTIMAVQEPATAATYEMAVNVISTRSAVLHYASTGDTAQRTRIATLDREFKSFKSRFDLVARSASSRELAHRIDDAYLRFHGSGDSLVEASDEWRAGAAQFARRAEAIEALVNAETLANRESKGKDGPRRLAEAALLQADVEGVGSAVGHFIPSLDGRYRARVTYYQGHFQETLGRYRAFKLSAEELERTRKIEAAFSGYLDGARAVIELRETVRDRWTRFLRSGLSVERLVDEGIRSLARTDLIEAQRSARQAIRTSLIAVLVLLVAGILIGSGTAFPTARSIVRSDQALRARMKDLSESDQRKDEFLGVLGHELRNPLATLSNALHVLSDHEAEVPEDVRSHHRMMTRQVRNISRLVDDLLDVSRINQGKITLRREPVDLVRVAAEAAEDLRPLVDARGHHLGLDLPHEPLWVHADPTRLAQIAANLLHNAVKYTPEGGRITLQVRRTGGQAELEVSDNGIGIASEMLPRVFEPFTQAEHSLAGVSGGLGIGLALVKRLVEMHGGSATAESAGPNRGSTFTVRLPATAAPAAATPRPAAPTGAAGRRILVVDDNQDSAESMAALLRLWGHEVHVAHDGPSGLEVAAAVRPDLALLDIGLPGLDGYQMAERLRGAPNGHVVTLIALTGLGLEEDRQRALSAGFDRHLTKPVDPEVLKALIAEARHA